jgi:hypothetical protein
MITQDYYGNTISEGVKVAFNFQGELRKGTVLRIVGRTQHGKTQREWGSREPYLTIHVEHCDDGEISKISSRKNLVVI